jgi:hypothetical protein
MTIPLTTTIKKMATIIATPRRFRFNFGMGQSVL